MCDTRDATEERNILLDDVYENIQNDVIGFNQEIKMVEPIIENELFYEDIMEKDRLNDDMDLDDDVRIRSLFETKKLDQSYIRKLRNSELNLRMHPDGGANRSVTDNVRLLHNARDIPSYTMHGAQKEGPIINCVKVGYIKLMCRG